MIGIIWAIVDGTISFMVDKIFNAWFMGISPAQNAVNEETKMAQDVADAPDQAQAVKDLDDDKV